MKVTLSSFMAADFGYHIGSHIMVKIKGSDVVLIDTPAAPVQNVFGPEPIVLINHRLPEMLEELKNLNYFDKPKSKFHK